MNLDLHHIHLLGKAYLRNPPVDEQSANDWLLDLVATIEMKVLIGPFSIHCETLGNEGVTGAVVIETSHCSGHFWHKVERPFVTFDVYSCVNFSPETVLKNLHKHFDVEVCEYALIDRNDTIKIIESGNWSPY